MPGATLALLLALPLASPQDAGRDDPPFDPSRELVVATKEAPPFSLRSSEGQWIGYSVELWESAAADAGWRYRIVEEEEVEGLLEAVSSGRADAAVAGLSVTADREERMDFTHPVLVSGLGIAVHGQPQGRVGSLLALLRGMLSWQFVSAIGTLAAVLAIAGVLVWLFERRANPEEFGGHGLRGLGEGFWWSAVTMTTVGYGDRAPKTVGGRVVGLFWMFTSVIVISFFTAGIASSLTIGGMGSRVRSSADLAGAKVGAIRGSTGAEWLERRDIGFRAYDRLTAALDDLEADRLEAVVHDAPMLSYLAKQREDADLEVLPERLERQSYAIALPEGSPRTERLNRALLRVLSSREGEVVRRAWLGE